MGFSQPVLVASVQLHFGTVQSLYRYEFDTPQRRSVWVRHVGGT